MLTRVTSITFLSFTSTGVSSSHWRRNKKNMKWIAVIFQSNKDAWQKMRTQYIILRIGKKTDYLCFFLLNIFSSSCERAQNSDSIRIIHMVDLSGFNYIIRCNDCQQFLFSLILQTAVSIKLNIILYNLIPKSAGKLKIQ